MLNDRRIQVGSPFTEGPLQPTYPYLPQPIVVGQRCDMQIRRAKNGIIILWNAEEYLFTKPEELLEFVQNHLWPENKDSPEGS